MHDDTRRHTTPPGNSINYQSTMMLSTSSRLFASFGNSEVDVWRVSLPESIQYLMTLLIGDLLRKFVEFRLECVVSTRVATKDAGEEGSMGLIYVGKGVCGEVMVLVGAVSPFGDRCVDL